MFRFTRAKIEANITNKRVEFVNKQFITDGQKNGIVHTHIFEYVCCVMSLKSLIERR